jgi:alanine dehydrogenase
MSITIGLPRMHKEVEERRDFLPDLVHHLIRLGATEVVIEDGYGAGMEISLDRYLELSTRVRVGHHGECLGQAVVLVLRCPDREDFARLRPDALLLTMLHPRTRPERVEALQSQGVHGVSLDAVTDDAGSRLIENLEAVGWIGVREAFRQIRRNHPRFEHPGRRPLHVTCLGSGAVGSHAIRAATRYGDPDLREAMVAKDVPGVEVTVVDFDLTSHEDYMFSRLGSTDLLIDATQRQDASRPVIPNRWLSALTPDAVLLDLACDPYLLDTTPPLVKGIEGIPDGSLAKYVFPVDDPAWNELDARIDTTHRRLTLSCYSWPGLDPFSSMQRYGRQLEPLLNVIFDKPGMRWDPESDSSFERAMARAEVTRWNGHRTH